MRRQQPSEATPTAVAVIRPRQSILIALLAAYGGLVALIVVGALRRDEVVVAWFGAPLALVFLPVVEFYRRALAIEPDALVASGFRSVRRIAFDDIVAWGIRRGHVYKSGTWTWLCIFARDGTRIDVALDVLAPPDAARIVETVRDRAPQARTIEPARDRIGGRLHAVLGVGALLIALGLVVLGITLPRTLDGQRLFSEAAAIGLIAGLALGTAASRGIVPKAPIAVVVMAGLAAMAVVPAAALFANMALRAPMRTTGLTVLGRKLYADDHGRVVYRLVVDIDRVQRRLSPPRDVGPRLEPGKTFDACVRDGVLGFTVIFSYTNACGDTTGALRR